MEDQSYNVRLYDFNVGAGTTSGGAISASQAAVTGEKFVCTGITASGDAACLVTIESPSGTALYKQRYASAFTLNLEFSHPSIVGAIGQALILKVSAATTNAEGYIRGYAIKG